MTYRGRNFDRRGIERVQMGKGEWLGDVLILIMILEVPDYLEIESSHEEQNIE